MEGRWLQDLCPVSVARLHALQQDCPQMRRPAVAAISWFGCKQEPSSSCPPGSDVQTCEDTAKIVRAVDSGCYRS